MKKWYNGEVIRSGLATIAHTGVGESGRYVALRYYPNRWGNPPLDRFDLLGKQNQLVQHNTLG